MRNDIYFMKIAYKEALKAYDKNEIPVGVVIVKDNKILSKGHNLRDSKNIVTKHAEIIAIEKANKKLNNWRLNDCILYTTLEPCPMCYETIKACKISRVVYAAESNIDHKKCNLLSQIGNKELIYECEQLIKDAFKNIREKNN